MSAIRFIRIEAKRWVGGLVIDGNGRVIEAPPIAKWLLGKTVEDVQRYAGLNQWMLVASDVVVPGEGEYRRRETKR